MSSEKAPAWAAAADGDAVLLRIKAVPGAKRDEIAGELGDRLKVRVSAAPEDGKANKAICALIAKRLGVRKKDVRIHSGMTNPEKIVRVEGIGVEAAWKLGKGQ